MSLRVTTAWWAAVLLIGTTSASAQRLPDSVRPEHYRLRLAPDLASATFRGHAAIDVTLRTATNAITLHSAELQLTTVTVTAGGRSQTARVTTDSARETATLQTADRLAAGPAVIDIEYAGTLNSALRGFYLSKANGRNYAVTQMEATDARRAFPSFDEPAYKATFDVSAVVDRSDTAISNGRLLSDVAGPEAGKHTLTFATTPRISTYLVALIVGDFQCRSGASNGTAIRVCSTPDKLARTGFALEAAKQQLAFYDKYFGIKYPFGKLDIIGIPDFSAGAMENAGAITFRERLLLVDPAASSPEAKKAVASVVAHEIAHQWFGNLVTMEWWNDIWLNEGFATWMALKPLAAWRPDWHVEEDEAFATQAALELDVLQSTRPIRTAAETPAEINELFDAIAYDKTAAVLRMIESYVGAEAFRAGVQSYLKKHAFANATGEDFWSEITRVTGKPVDAIMRSFVDQPGAPVLSASGACREGDRQLTLTQERFRGSGDSPPSSSSEHWTVPACIRARGGKARCEVVEQRTKAIAADSCAALLNAGERGYYFSQYAPAALHELRRDLLWLRPVERIGLLGDEWWMARSGRHDVGEYLELAGALAATEAGPVITTMADHLETIANEVAPASDLPRFEAWIRSRFTPALDKIGLPGRPADSETTQANRAALAALVGSIGNDPQLQARMRGLVDDYLARPSTLAPSLVRAALQIAALHGDGVLYDRYRARMQMLTGQPEEYYPILAALSWFRDPALIARTLDLSLSPSLRTQDSAGVLGALLERPWSREPAWTFIRAHWSELSERLGAFSGMPTIVNGLGSFCSPARASEVRQFFADHPTPTANRTIEQAIERIQSCAAFRERQAPAFSRWLSGAS